MRHGISAATLTVLVCAFMFATGNATFWGHALRIFDGDRVGLLTLSVALFFLLLALTLPFSQRFVVKPFLMILLMVSASAAHFVDTYGVLIDREMVQNIFETTQQEAVHLFSFSMARDIVLWGVLPALVVAFVPLRAEAFWPKTGRTVVVMAASLAITLGLLATDKTKFNGVYREKKELMASFHPAAPLAAAFRYARQTYRSQNVVVAPLGRDARPGPWLARADRPVVAVFVVGETARAQNWSLGGYARPTNPQLATRPVTYFTDVTACGTSTAVSLPCMMSDLTGSDYSHIKGKSRENLVDVLGHAGFATKWLENNVGSAGVAVRTVQEKIPTDSDPVLCASGECDDRILITRLAAELPKITGNTALFLHMMGSHGPSYYLRYPPEMAVFQPTCDTIELSTCSAEQLLNTYDNTIHITDHVLAGLIDLLAARDDILPVLFYVSDHGESLGENGIYLHAAPMFMAPEFQTKVPMLSWLSPAAEQALGVTKACLDARAGQALTHDVVFSSFLGLLDIQTDVRAPALDLTEGCRPADPA